MQVDKKKVESSLKSKGFIIDETHHRYFIYKTKNGKLSPIKTKTSHGSNKSINDYLIGQMARQCRLDKSSFLDLINCPLTQDKYELIMSKKGEL